MKDFDARRIMRGPQQGIFQGVPPQSRFLATSADPKKYLRGCKERIPRSWESFSNLGFSIVSAAGRHFEIAPRRPAGRGAMDRAVDRAMDPAMDFEGFRRIPKDLEGL